MIRAFLSFILLWFFAQTTSQILAQDSRPRTNDGTVFQDPFGEEAPTEDFEDAAPADMPDDNEFPVFVDESDLSEDPENETPLPSNMDEGFENEDRMSLEDEPEGFSEPPQAPQAPDSFVTHLHIPYARLC